MESEEWRGMEPWWDDDWQGNTKVLAEKPATVPLFLTTNPT